MLITPHISCAQVLDTLRESGLTYTLSETPYSVYLTLRKKFTKDHSSTKSATRPQHVHKNLLDLSSEHEDVIAKLQEALDHETSKHKHTKHQLTLREAEVTDASDANNSNIDEARRQYQNLTSTINTLKEDLAQEIDDHAQSENALKKLEEKVENFKDELKTEAKNRADIIEENESLHEKLEDAEQASENLRTLIHNQNEKLVRYELKQAELALLDTSLLNAKVTELEGTISGKNRIISLLKDQVTLSLKEIAQLRQKQSISAPPVTTDILHSDTFPHKFYSEESSHFHLSQPCSSSESTAISSSLGTSAPSLSSGTTTLSSSSDTSAFSSYQLLDTSAVISQLGTSKTSQHIKALDQNDNLHPNKSPSHLENSPVPPTASQDSHSPSSLSKYPCIPTDPEKYCQNCKNELSDDFDVFLPLPVYMFDFIAKCSSPWLHYGYCTPCLEVARFESTDITHYIAQCTALIDQCWDGEQEDHIEHYKEKETEFA